MKKIFFILLLSPLFLSAQTDTSKGINWTTGLSWEQVKQKAKQENKYIFIDAYATWCGPCKMMDKDIYPKLKVGNYFNDKFISVKVQMDQTKKDDDEIKRWYSDAILIMKQYRITAFPTYLFFSPDGVIVHKERGYKSTDQFIEIGKQAAVPGKKYVDPFKDYDAFVEKYNRGKKDYKAMPEMIKKARELNERQLVKSLSKDYFDYLSRINKRKWYKKVNIQCISENLKDSRSPFFQLFYREGRKIDTIMRKPGFSASVVDKVIDFEITQPFLAGFYKGKTDKELLASGLEPAWDTLELFIKARFDENYVNRAVRAGKLAFYRYTNNKPEYIKIFGSQMEKGEVDLKEKRAYVNECAWMVFKSNSNKEQLITAINWMSLIVNDIPVSYVLFDTYANLLYKASMLFNVNRFDEAIEIEKKALEDAISREVEGEILSIKEVIKKMQQRVPTW